MKTIPGEISLFECESESSSPANFGLLLPQGAKLTALARKMYSVLLQITVQQIAYVGAPIPHTHSYSAPLSEILAPEVAQGHENLTDLAKTLLREVCRTEIVWTAPKGTRSGVIWATMSLLAHAKLIIKEDGVTWADWSFCPSINSALLSPGFLIPFENADYCELKTNASIVLYEICAPCLARPDGATSKHSTEWWISALSNYALKIDTETKQLKLRDWRKVKKEKVIPAINEINEKTELFVKMQEFKRGKEIVEVQFFVQKKVSVSDSILASLDLTPALAEKVDNMALLTLQPNVAEPMAADATDQSVGENNLGVSDSSEALEAATKPTVNNASPENRFLLSGPTSRSWHEMRRMEITAELMALQPDLQDLYVEKAIESLKRANMLTANLARKLKNGEWKGGFLLNKVLEIYLRENYPADWDVEPEE